MRLVIGAATDVGRVREGNEDGYLVDEPMGLVAVADGVGGHRAGEVASATALEALRAAVNSGHSLREAIEDANEAVFAKSLTDDDYQGMGTTLTAATLASGGTLLVGHVGDSRAYLLHDGELPADHHRPQPRRRSSSTTAGSPPKTPPCTRCATSSRARSASEPSVDVDVYPVELAARRPHPVLLRRPHRHAARRLPRRPSCAASDDPARAATRSSTRRTAPAASTTSPSSS